MKLPDKPEFMRGNFTAHEGGAWCGDFLIKEKFDVWYEKTFAGAVEVTGRIDPGDLGWTGFNRIQAPYDTHTALMINIQPIKQPSADDLLREVYLRRGENGLGHECHKKIGEYLSKVDALKKGNEK